MGSEMCIRDREKICQFCTMAHIANVVCLFGFWRAGKMHEEGLWNDEAPVEAENKKDDEK